MARRRLPRLLNEIVSAPSMLVIKKWPATIPSRDRQQQHLGKNMKLPINLKRLVLVGCTLLATTFLPVAARAADDEYSFKVKNTTKELITKILVSEDGEKYGFFDIGEGIKPGETMTLVWDKSTNSGSCHQWFKAVWESGEEGKPVKFDFCEKDLVLEF
jgi:hypothetical protein